MEFYLGLCQKRRELTQPFLVLAVPDVDEPVTATRGERAVERMKRNRVHLGVRGHVRAHMCVCRCVRVRAQVRA